MRDILTTYLDNLQTIINQGDYREESFYHCLKGMIDDYASLNQNTACHVTILPKATDAGNPDFRRATDTENPDFRRATDAGNPDFRIWDGKARITGYIEAKNPNTYNLDPIALIEQLKRYIDAFPNFILTNFYEFRLYQDGRLITTATIASPINATQMRKTPPVSDIDEFTELLDRYFSFSLPAISDPRKLANVLAKRTRFLRDEILDIMQTDDDDRKVLQSFFDSFKALLINNLTIEQFADLYAQTLTYGIFAARTRSEGEFHRELIYKNIPNTLGILQNIFRFISLETPPKAIEVLIDDIADILSNTDIQNILALYHSEGKGVDPIVYFYETFLGEYDLELKNKRGVFYTPEPVVQYIVRSIHSLLKSRFNKSRGLASNDVTILDPAAGTLTFPAEAIKIAIEEYEECRGDGNIYNLIRNHILPNFYAIELMMAPYTVGHLKIGYLLKEYNYDLSNNERFKLYLSNTLEPDHAESPMVRFVAEISDECKLANEVKFEQQILVIMGNPPYSGESQTRNKWTENLLKTDIDGTQNYYSVDGIPITVGTKWLQDDYVKFMRFAQWKIHREGKGIVGMITNHAYIDNPTFRGMRQSLMKTFDEIYILDLHGNKRRRETCPDGNIDENVFDIQQGTAIIFMVKTGLENDDLAKVFHGDLYGSCQNKYNWLTNNEFNHEYFEKINPISPSYLFRPITPGNEHYLNWVSLPDIFPINGVGIVTSRDNLTIHDNANQVRRTIHHFSSLDVETARAAYQLPADVEGWDVESAQNDLIGSELDDEKIVPILYRPFDIRYTYYTGKSVGFHGRPRKIMKHMLQENVGLITVRQVAERVFNHVFITDTIVESRITISNRGMGFLFPLYLYPDIQDEEIFLDLEREYNIAQEFIDRFSSLWSEFQPEQLFYYIYAILNSNLYRRRFEQYLSIDFPRIPFTNDYDIFCMLAELGEELADIHLMNSAKLKEPFVMYNGRGPNDRVDQIEYDADRTIVRINQNKYFQGITPELWDYRIGGYQVLHKYLDERKDKNLTDPVHFCKIAKALALTINIQDQIDQIIESVIQ